MVVPETYMNENLEWIKQQMILDYQVLHSTWHFKEYKPCQCLQPFYPSRSSSGSNTRLPAKYDTKCGNNRVDLR